MAVKVSHDLTNQVFQSAVESNEKQKGNKKNKERDGQDNDRPTRIPLRYVGLLQLAAHDLFNVDRISEVDAEKWSP